MDFDFKVFTLRCMNLSFNGLQSILVRRLVHHSLRGYHELHIGVIGLMVRDRSCQLKNGK